MILDRGGKRTAFWALVGIAALLWTAACDSGGEDTTEGSGEESTEGGGTTTQPVGGGGQTFTLAAGFTAVTQAGTAGGNQNAMDLYPDTDCLGTVASSADHVITVEGDVGVAINITADEDTTLVITGPGGPYCNDDFDGLNPGWQGTLAAGEYQVFVGTYNADEGGVPYTLVASPWAEPVPEPVVEPPVPEGTAEGTAAAPPTPAPGP